MKFEDIEKELSKVIEKLEDKEISLDEGIKLFDQGIKLTENALEILNEGQGKIKVLKAKLDKLCEENFDDGLSEKHF